MAATSFQKMTMSTLPVVCCVRWFRKRTRKFTSSCVNATPLPVVLRYSCRGGDGVR